jgi:predicted RNA-binding protein Jag
VQSFVGSGPTLEDAVKDALSRLGATPEQVVLRKVEEGSAGLLGNAARPYRVRATWRPEFAPPPPPPAPVRAAPEREAFQGDAEAYAPSARPSSRDGGGRGGRPDRGGRGDRGDRGARGGRDRETFIDPEMGKEERLSRPARKAAPPHGDEPFLVDDAFLDRVREEATTILAGMGMDATLVVSGTGDEVLVAIECVEDPSAAEKPPLPSRHRDREVSLSFSSAHEPSDMLRFSPS